jgi:hypothetical protein
MASRTALVEVKRYWKKFIPLPIQRVLGRWKDFFLDHTQFIENILGLWKKMFFKAELVQSRRMRTFLLKVIRLSGDVVLIMRDFPMVKAYLLEGEAGRIIFIGREILEFKHLFFQNQPVIQGESQAIWSWQLPLKTKDWQANGADMVVFGVSRYFPWRAKSAYCISTPKWVSQFFIIPENCDEPPPGNISRALKKIYRNNQGRLDYRFSRDLADFDLFYHKMYRPYVSNRHGEFVYVESYEYLLKWFTKGGVIIVNYDGEPTGGVLVLIKGDCIYLAESGIFNGDPNLQKKGISRVSIWSSVQWSKLHGCKKVQMGGSYALRSNGVFQYKTFWNTGVEDFYGFIRNEWMFYLENPKSNILNYLNSLGIIHEKNHSYYATWFATKENDLPKEIQEATKAVNTDGLDGIVLLTSGKKKYIKKENLL